MNREQTELNIVRERKKIPMVQMAKSMDCNRKTLFNAFNSVHVSNNTIKAMCKAVDITMGDLEILVERQEQFEKGAK